MNTLTSCTEVQDTSSDSTPALAENAFFRLQANRPRVFGTARRETRLRAAGRGFELTIREVYGDDNRRSYVAWVRVLDERHLRSNSFRCAGWSKGEVEQRARQWISEWKK